MIKFLICFLPFVKSLFMKPDEDEPLKIGLFFIIDYKKSPIEKVYRQRHYTKHYLEWQRNYRRTDLIIK